MRVGRVVELESEAILIIIKEEVKLGEGAQLNLELRLTQWVIAVYYICSIPGPLSCVSPFQEVFDSHQILGSCREVNLFLLNVPNHCSTA